MPGNWSCLGGQAAQVGGLGECNCVYQCVHVSLDVCSFVHPEIGMYVRPGTRASHAFATREPCMTGTLRVEVILRNLTGALET